MQDRQGRHGYQTGGIYRSEDGGETWNRVNSLNPRPMYYSQVRVDPNDDRYVYVCGVSLYMSEDGGESFISNAHRGQVHLDQHALWIDPRDGRHIVVGCDGGLYQTHDRTQNWDHLNDRAIGQFYHVVVDNRKPYYVYGGMQDNGNWMGPSHNRSSRGIINEEWTLLSGGDGFVVQVDPTDADIVYTEIQDGSITRRNLAPGRARGSRRARRRGNPTGSIGIRRSSSPTRTRRYFSSRATGSSGPTTGATTRGRSRPISRGPIGGARRRSRNRRATATCFTWEPTTGRCGGRATGGKPGPI